MMGVARLSLRRTANLQFWKLLGSGSGEGFTPKPNFSVYGLLCVWPSHAAAQDFIERSALMARYTRQADEVYTLYLATHAVRGSWSGGAPFECADITPRGPIAALTRATLKLRHMRRFWQQEPNISARIGRNSDVVFKIGLGELPMMQQMTFSIWPSEEAMNHFARDEGAHAQAISHVRQGGWFKEELYARFSILGSHGTWHGAEPLSGLDTRKDTT